MKISEDFVPITPEHVPLIESFIRQTPPERLCCEYAPANLLAWDDSYRMHIRATADRLWISDSEAGHFLFPLGEDIRPDELRAVAFELCALGQCGPCISIPRDWAEANREGFADWATYRESEDSFDYLYAADDLALLPGAKFSPKRNLIHQFQRAHPGYTVTDVAPVNGNAPAEVQAFLQKWKVTADDSAGDLDEESLAMLRAYNYWGSGIFEGIEIRDERGLLVSLAIYSFPVPGLGVEHFEKADHNVKGASQMATWEAAKRMRARGAKWINREQDLGVPGLRRAKESYNPVKHLAFGELQVVR